MTITALPQVREGRPLTVAESAFVELFNQYSAMEDLIRSAAELLPELPVGRKHRRAKCCTTPELKVVTIGMQQWSEYTAETNQAYGDGWDDLGDGQPDTYLTCLTCDRTFRVPTDMSWS
jgi:hypothetical protein